VTANVSNANVVELTATKVSGLIYLEAGKSYSFTGSADDSLAVTVGGKLVSTETWSQGTGINATPFTPTESGYYTLDIYHYNQAGRATTTSMSRSTTARRWRWAAAACRPIPAWKR